MLDDDASRLTELFDALQCGIGIGDVVVRQFLALQLFGGGDTGFVQLTFNIKRGRLMAVFAVTHILLFNKVQVQGTREAASRLAMLGVIGRNQGTEVVGDHAVVSGGMLEGSDGQIKTGGMA